MYDLMLNTTIVEALGQFDKVFDELGGSDDFYGDFGRWIGEVIEKEQVEQVLKVLNNMGY
jgi:hypothetical protein